MHFYIHIRNSIVEHIINEEPKHKKTKTAFLWSQACKTNTCLLPPQFNKEENI